MGLSTMEELRRRDQIGDRFERRDQIGDGFKWRDQTGVIKPAEPWVGDWIWASPAIALSVLRLGLGVSDESE